MDSGLASMIRPYQACARCRAADSLRCYREQAPTLCAPHLTSVRPQAPPQRVLVAHMVFPKPCAKPGPAQQSAAVGPAAGKSHVSLVTPCYSKARPRSRTAHGMARTAARIFPSSFGAATPAAARNAKKLVAPETYLKTSRPGAEGHLCGHAQQPLAPTRGCTTGCSGGRAVWQRPGAPLGAPAGVGRKCLVGIGFLPWLYIAPASHSHQASSLPVI